MNPENQDAETEETTEQETQSQPETNQSEESNEEVVNTLEADYKALEAERDQLQDKLLRVQAEFDNFKKRSSKEKEADRKYRSQDLVQDILPVLDNFERALNVETTDENKSFIDGMNMIYNQLVEALSKEGVEEIKSTNEPFDPNFHHAVMQVEDDAYESNVVVEELQKGYKLNDRVIRAAMVKVNQ